MYPETITAVRENFQCLSFDERRFSAIRQNASLLTFAKHLSLDSSCWTRVVRAWGQLERIERLRPGKRAHGMERFTGAWLL
jgi:hypothetical protein